MWIIMIFPLASTDVVIVSFTILYHPVPFTPISFPFRGEFHCRINCTSTMSVHLDCLYFQSYFRFLFFYPHNVMLHFYSDCNNLVTFVRVKTWMKFPTSTRTRFLIYQRKSVKTNAVQARCTKQDHSFMLLFIDQ